MQKTRRPGPRKSAGPVSGAAYRAATAACEPLADPLEDRDPGSAPGDEDRQDQEQQWREGSEASRRGDGERERRCDEQKQRGCGPLRSVRCPGHGSEPYIAAPVGRAARLRDAGAPNAGEPGRDRLPAGPGALLPPKSQTPSRRRQLASNALSAAATTASSSAGVAISSSRSSRPSAACSTSRPRWTVKYRVPGSESTP